MSFQSERLLKYQTLLSEVDLAISAVLGGQEYMFDDGQTKQSVTRADLDKLKKLQSFYEEKIQQLSGTQKKVVYGGGAW